MAMMIFLSLVVALMAAFSALVVTMFITAALALGDLGMLLSFYIAPLAAGVWMFIFMFNRLRRY
jgi:hypothetical protein